MIRALLLAGLLVGCDDAAPNSESPSRDAAADVGGRDDAERRDGGIVDAVVDAAPDVGVPLICPDAGACPEGARRVGCECFDAMDRRCLTDGDCRPDERCESAEGVIRFCRYEPPPLRRCPAEACPGNDDRTLYAAFASRDVTPLGFEPPTAAGLDGSQMAFDPPFPEMSFLDCGLDGLCLDDAGYPGPDEGEADGQMQGLWLAGFSNGRPAQYCPPDRVGCDRPDCCVSKFAHDPIRVQTAVVRQGGVTVAFAAVDTVGLFHTDIERVRRRVAEVGVDLLIMGATHNHEAPDTSGQWGPGRALPIETGRSPAFMAAIEDGAVAAISEGVANLRPARLRAHVLDVGVRGLAINDSRTPYIFNDDLPVVHFVAADTGDAIGTLLSFGNHAEALWASNPYISSDYPHFVRHYVTNGLGAVAGVDGRPRPALPGTGAEVVFFAGSVGGLINPGHGGALDYAGNPPPSDHGFEVADAIGQTLASHVLSALVGDLVPEADVEAVPLHFATQRFLLAAENEVFRLAALVLGVIQRDVYNATLVSGVFVPGPPQVLTQVAVVRLGPVTFFTAPGEVFGELLCGGYPGRHTARRPVVGDVEGRTAGAECDEEGLPVEGGQHPCIITADHEHPPDWSNAPEGPYVYELVPGDVPFFIGLGMDFLGYLVPPYDFAGPAFTTQAPGDHYEETNSIGPEIVPIWLDHLESVLGALEAP